MKYKKLFFTVCIFEVSLSRNYCFWGLVCYVLFFGLFFQIAVVPVILRFEGVVVFEAVSEFMRYYSEFSAR